jgi:UDP-N-acetylglucosamine acyltransferase
MAITIHPSSFVDPKAQLADGVEIGPFCIVNGAVTLGEGVKLISHVTVHGPVVIGARTVLYPGCNIGLPGQDFKFKMGDPTAGVVIGDDCLLREHVTIHAATKVDKPTRVGNKVLMMVASHAGHDATIGNGVIMANSAMLGGHALLEDNVIMSGNTAMHQFTRMGRMSFVTGNCGCSMDVPPFCVVSDRNRVTTINLVGLRRSGASRDEITHVRRAFWKVFRNSLTKPEMLEKLTELAKDSALVAEQLRFVQSATRPICRGRVGGGDEELV